MPTTMNGQPRQGVPPERKSDRGPIPPGMLDDLRGVLWSMEKVPLYWAIGMGVIVGAVFISGIILLALTGLRNKGGPDNAIGGIALALLVAMIYSPFFNWWFEYRLEANWLRQALYPRQLEDLAEYMAICVMRDHTKIARRLLNVWKKHGLEPGWSARPLDPPPLFK